MSTADRTSTVLMLGLSFGTGILDAATYLGLHGVFTANMTGNVVFIGLGVAGSEGIPLLRSTLAIGGFVLGAVVIGLLQRHKDVVQNTDGIAALTFAAVAVVLSGTAAVLGFATLSTPVLDLMTIALALAMGAQAVAARRVGVGDVSTVVVTSTLAGLAAENAWTGNLAGRAATSRRLAAVLSMGLGAVAGAFLLRWDIAVPVALAAAIVVVVASVSGWRFVRRRRSQASMAAEPPRATATRD